MNRIRLALTKPAFELKVDLVLPPQGITVLFGPSGSGKTTLLRCVAGLERAPEAFVQLGPDVWQDDSRGIYWPTWKRSLGYVFQEASLLEHLDVQGNLQYGLTRTQQPGQQQALEAAIELLGIGALLSRRAHQLSGGERQRVAIARAVATQPALLLLDEPLASLDHARRQDILPWLERLRDESRIPMLYVTHAADEVARLAHTLVLLQGGHVSACGPVAEVMARMDNPALAGDDRAVLLEGTLQERDTQWSLARVDFVGGSLWVGDTHGVLGQHVRLRVLARDVSIATEQPHHTSIQNVLACVVGAIQPDGHPSQVLVQLHCAKNTLLARITARAVAELDLTPGKSVWAQVKSVALVA